MPAPVYSAGTIGNALPRTAIAAGKNAAGLLDLTVSGLNSEADIEGQVTCKLVVGASALTAATTFYAYKVYGPSTTISTYTNSTSIAVASAADIDVGQKVLIQQAGGSKLGEIATVTGVSGTTLTVATLENTYQASDNFYLINQTASWSVAPASTTGTWAINTVYSMAMYLSPARWAIAAINGDGSVGVTVVATCDFIQGFE